MGGQQDSELGALGSCAKELRARLDRDVDDRMQEGMALTWKPYREQAEHGRELEPALLVHACRLRTQDLSRTLANDRRQQLRDAYDPRTQLAGRVALLDVDSHGNALGMAGATCVDPTYKIGSAIDLGDWLGTLCTGGRGTAHATRRGVHLEGSQCRDGLAFEDSLRPLPEAWDGFSAPWCVRPSADMCMSVVPAAVTRGPG